MPAPSFAIRRVGGRDEIRIPARWSIGALLFFVVWLIAWSVAGAALARWWPPWTWIGLVWLAAKLVFGWFYAGVALAWMLGGVERIAVTDQDLIVRYAILGVPVVTRTYRGRDIRYLGVSGMPQAGGFADPSPPFLSSSRCGALKFLHRESTVYLGHDLGAADARSVVLWLARLLPSGAMEDQAV